MVEGARLESVYTRKGIAGSNPALSAKQSRRVSGIFVYEEIVAVSAKQSMSKQKCSPDESGRGFV